MLYTVNLSSGDLLRKGEVSLYKVTRMQLLVKKKKRLLIQTVAFICIISECWQETAISAFGYCVIAGTAKPLLKWGGGLAKERGRRAFV